MSCRCRQCLPTVDGIRHTDTPRTLPPLPVLEKVDDIIVREVRAAVRRERQRCADIAALYPLEKFAYDCANTGELLRLRDTISEAILKGSRTGEGIS